MQQRCATQGNCGSSPLHSTRKSASLISGSGPVDLRGRAEGRRSIDQAPASGRLCLMPAGSVLGVMFASSAERGLADEHVLLAGCWVGIRLTPSSAPSLS